MCVPDEVLQVFVQLKYFEKMDMPNIQVMAMSVIQKCPLSANFTERKNTHPPVKGVKEFVCLSVTNFDLYYLRTGKIVKVQLNGLFHYSDRPWIQNSR